jgi:hypothetical protein
MGDRFIALLNAAKRLSTHGAGTTRMHKVAALRRIAKAVATYSSPASPPQQWLTALETYLRHDEDCGDTTRWTYFNHGSAIISEAARFEGTSVRSVNPFKRRRLRRVEVVHEAEVERLLRRAKSDVFAYVTRFRNPPTEHVPYIQRGRDLWLSLGALSVMNFAGVRSLSDEWREASNLPFQHLQSYLYPSPLDLAPFLLLIGNALAGNPDSISLMRRDAAEPFTHPAYGPCYKLQLEKPRAGSIAPYLIRNKTTLSVGWLIDAVLEITAPLVPLATARNRDLAFLAVTSPTSAVKPLTGALRVEAIRRYLVSKKLAKVTLKELRTYRGIAEYRKSGDVFRVKKLLNQASITTTLDYLEEHLIADVNEMIIANVQAGIPNALTPAHAVSGVVSDFGAVGVGHICANPHDPSKPRDENGFCVNYLWPFNDRCFVLDFSPRPIAFLLRDYAALCDAQLRLSTERFERYYAARKRKIEADMLPFISANLRRDAEALMPSLPPAPTID